jgi:hypothetical protein
MKKTLSLKLRIKTIVFLFALILFTKSGFSQDTLHLNYIALQPKMPDTTEAKITDWAKKLNGKHMDVEILAYYSQSDFKKYSTERSEDVYLIVLRKARDFVTITKNDVVKGAKSQRSRVDIVYWPTGSDPIAKEKAEKDKKEAEAKKAADEKALAEKTKKDEVKANEKQKDKLAETKVKDSGSNKNKKETGETKEKNQKEKTDNKADKSSTDEQNNKAELSYGRPKKKPTNEGSNVTRTDMIQIKASKIIVAQIGNKDLDDALFNAVKNFWTFTSDIGQMPYNKAMELAKKSDSVLVLSQTQTSSSSLPRDYGNTGWQYKRISGGRMIMIENGKQKVLLGNNIPAIGEDGVLTEEILSFGVSAMNSVMIIFDKYNLKNSLNTKPKFKDYAGDRIKNRTLLIPKEILEEKINESIISKIYPGNFKIVPYEEYKKAILTKEKGMAYVMFSPMAVGGKILNIQYIMDAEDGFTLGLYVPSGTSVDLGPVFGEKNVSKGNTGEVTEKCLKGYKEVYNGDW